MSNILDSGAVVTVNKTFNQSSAKNATGSV